MRQRWTRREFIGDSLLGAAALAGCGGASSGDGLEGDGGPAPGGQDPPGPGGSDDPEAGGPGVGGDRDPGAEADAEPDEEAPHEIAEGEGEGEAPPDEGGDPAPRLPSPTMREDYWHTCAAWVRSAPDSGLGTRFHLFNPADVPMSLDLHVMTPSGGAVVDTAGWRTLAPGASVHPTLAEILAEHEVERGKGGLFEGTLWLGSKPESGRTFLGLQAFGVDWFGPSHHLAAVHAMRDFGNSNHDMIWTDLILPKVVLGPRFETHVALANASGVNGDLTRVANPWLSVHGDDGRVLGELIAEDLPAYGARLVALSEILGAAGAADLPSASLRVREAEVGLVAVAFIVDKEHGGFVNADHLFDRNFVDCVPFGLDNGCETFLEPF